MESEEQYIRINAVMQIIGKPKEFIEKKMKEYIEKIKEDNDLMLVKEKVSDAREKEKIWSVFGEIEVVIKGMSNLVGFCIEYMPTSIEIIKPESFTFKEKVFTMFVNDMLSKLHRVDTIAKQLGTENSILKNNMNKIIQNNLLVLTRFGVNTLEGMKKGTGMEEEEVKRFLDILIKNARLKEVNSQYSLVENE